MSKLGQKTSTVQNIQSRHMPVPNGYPDSFRCVRCGTADFSKDDCPGWESVYEARRDAEVKDHLRRQKLDDWFAANRPTSADRPKRRTISPKDFLQTS